MERLVFLESGDHETDNGAYLDVNGHSWTKSNSWLSSKTC